MVAASTQACSCVRVVKKQRYILKYTDSLLAFASRLRTRIAYVQADEARLEEKRQHCELWRFISIALLMFREAARPRLVSLCELLASHF